MLARPISSKIEAAGSGIALAVADAGGIAVLPCCRCQVRKSEPSTSLYRLGDFFEINVVFSLWDHSSLYTLNERRNISFSRT